MYHRNLHIIFAGDACPVFDVMKKMPPMEGFTHTFGEKTNWGEAFSAGADVVFLNFQGQDEEDLRQILPGGQDAEGFLRMLPSEKSADCQLIVLAEQNQAACLTPYFPYLTDVWFLPMTEEEARFRFLRWQEAQKLHADFRQTNQYFETAINSSPDMVWYKAKDGIHEKVNDSFCRIVGKPREQVEGMDHCHIWDVGPEDALVCEKSDREVMEKKQTCIAEEAVKSGDEMKLFVTYKSPLYDFDGSVMGTVGLGVDITQERAYQQEIIQQNHTLEAVFSSLDCGILCHTLDGKVISANDAALRILGYKSPEDMAGQGFDMVARSVLDEDKPLLRASIRSLKNVGDNVNIEYRVLHEDGKILHVLGNAMLLEENGEKYYRRFLLDNTEKKREEREKENKHQELVEALTLDYSLVCAFDLDSGRGVTVRISEDNRGRLSGIFTDEIDYVDSFGRYIRTWVYEADRSALEDLLAPENLMKILAGKQLYSVNYRAVYDSKVQYYEMKIVRTLDWEHTHRTVIGLRNVNDQTRKEMEQKALMRNALEQADKASQAKSAFLSNMSHDIRTPMNAIIGFTNLAIGHISQKERVEDYLYKILDSGKHLLNLINHVLDMSRIESGKMLLEEKPCSLPELLCDLEDMIQADAQKKKISVRVDRKGLVNADVWCDQVRLNQVLLNVLSNSVKYTQEGGTVSLLAWEQAGTLPEYGNYHFQIKDNGIGMSPEFLAHVFEPFEREKNTTTSKIQGTGLGMSITKSIVELMNGTIEIKSRQGEGTEVSISVPLKHHIGQDADFSVSEDAETAQKGAKPSFSQLDGQGTRILLVEDNELNQEIAQIILEESGFLVETAGNGKEAVEKVAASEAGYYQVILMDVQMPVMDGYEATRAIRALQDERLASIPILAMTANAFEEDRKEALRNGMNGHITKPIELEKLFEALRQVLTEGSGRQ